jgi:1-acyl-sn-glycerol-3-phosphate acyltransferase
MSTLDTVVRQITFRLVHRNVRRHLGAVDGLEHVPVRGPFVLVANHSSYYDHFLIETVLSTVRSGRVWFLTKSEAFDKPLVGRWHTIMNAIPVDRTRPTAATFAQVREALQGDDVLVVYPEGTRGPGQGLLPFKDGAFWFAARNEVPVVPLGIAGAPEVLPRGALRPTRATAALAFGPALVDDPALPRRLRAESLRQQAEAAVGTLVDRASATRVRTSTPLAADRRASDAIAGLIAAHIDARLDPDGQLPADVRTRLRRLAVLARNRDPENPSLALQLLRLRGLRAMAAPSAVRPALALPLGRSARKTVRRDPAASMGHYLLGRWHLTVPRLLGGRRDVAVAHLAEAARTSPPSDTRYAMGYAEALLAAERSVEATEQLDVVIARTPSEGRGAARVARAQLLRDRLSTGPTPNTAPNTAAVTGEPAAAVPVPRPAPEPALTGGLA